jgi:hypothetical protein
VRPHGSNDMEIGRTDEDDELVLMLIQAAVLTGAYRSLAAFMPEAKSGLLKMADRHHARVAALAGEIVERAGAERGAAPTPPTIRI